jgi:DNA-binding transcriptional regulator YiaG
VNEKRTAGPTWDAYSIRGLRRHLEMTQQEMSDELGVRQQTISDWECGYHQPRGGMSRLLSIVAERAGYVYKVNSDPEPSEPSQVDETSAARPPEST